MHYRYTHTHIYIGFLVAQMAKICLQCRDLGSIPGTERSPEWLPTPIFLPGEFQDRGAWQALVHGVTKSFTQLSD